MKKKEAYIMSHVLLKYTKKPVKLIATVFIVSAVISFFITSTVFASPYSSDQRVSLGRLAFSLLKTRNPESITGFNPMLFGAEWTDNNTTRLGGNGCDTFDDIVTRDVTRITKTKATARCPYTPTGGVLPDPYTGETVTFTLIPSVTTPPIAPTSTTTNVTMRSVEIGVDRFVSLEDAWMTGAKNLSEQKRINFANDPRNLITTTKMMINQKKGAPANLWAPPNVDYRCQYAVHIAIVKYYYDLWLTPAEHTVLEKFLATCPT